MVLASMKMKEWKERAWKEGYEQGREEQHKRFWEAFDRFGVEVDGVLMLPSRPEVKRFLGWCD